MTPFEFWECEFKQMQLYCNCYVIRMNEEFKYNIILNEATTDKMLRADPLGNKRPKINPLTKTFKEFFKKSNIVEK